SQRALQIPEILHLIILYLDDQTAIPHEAPPQRRRPLSLRHAILIYGDTNLAHQVWEEALKEEATSASKMFKDDKRRLYNCLLVNKQWHEITKQVMYKRLHFCDDVDWRRFVDQHPPCLRRTHSDLLVLHKLKNAKQRDIEQIEFTGGNLKWLEFYMCPSIMPTPNLLLGGQLKKVILPGCILADDHFLKLVSKQCPQLETLDLRACDQITDDGLVYLARSCRQLKLLNVGRKMGGEKVTNRGMREIARYTAVNTLGAAGCHIDDQTMAEIALYRGPGIERLSLNNCHLLTNESISRILAYTPNLAVLELRGCLQITDMKTILTFKKFQEHLKRSPLIEGCEVFEARMRDAEWAMELEISRNIFRDCLEWIYADDTDTNKF
ncbi:RNI-like protein, partial [Nadsonia fulvescens var. elongata DSM 6958]